MCDQYATGMALERDDPVAGWVELLGANGQRAILKQGECWGTENRALAGSYRLRPQVYDPVPRPVDCANPAPFWLAPACPSVSTASPPPGSRQCARTFDLIDPREKTQCFEDLGASNAALYQSSVDLAQSQADLPLCVAQRDFVDADGDGDEDARDRCPGTPAGTPVDGDGCSRLQFCAAHAAICKKNDWLNDEPRAKKPGDCTYDKGARTCT